VTGDELNSMTRPQSVHNYTPALKTTNSQKPKEYINITQERSISNYQTALSSSGQHDVNYANTGSTLGSKAVSSKNIDRMLNFSQVDPRVSYSDTSKRTEVNNISYNEHMDLEGTKNKMKHKTTSNDKKEEARTEVGNVKHGLKYTSLLDEDNIASETENTYDVAGYVNKKPTKDNVKIINSGRDVFLSHEDHVYMSVRDKEVNAFPTNYNTEKGPNTSSYQTPRVLYKPISLPGRPALSPYRHILRRPSLVLAGTKPHGSTTSYYSLSFNSPYKSPSTSYIPKSTDSFESASILYSSVTSGPYRQPIVSYDSPPQKTSSASYSSPSHKPPSAPHVSPFQKTPSILHGSPPRKTTIAPNKPPPYKQSPLYNPPTTDLHQSPNTMHYSLLNPSYGSAPHKTPKPSYNTQPIDTHGSLTSSYSSSPHVSRPPTAGSSPPHKSHKLSYVSPQKSLGPSQSSELYKLPISSYSLSSNGSRPHKSDSSMHVSHRPSYVSPLQMPPRPSSESQPSELHESPTSPYSLTHDSRPLSISASTSYRPLHGSPIKMSYRPSYVSESTHSYDSPSFSASSSTVYSRPSSISESLPPHRSPTPSHDSQPKNSLRPLHDFESTDSYGSPSSPYSSSPRGSRPPSISEGTSYMPLHGSRPKMSQRPSYGSESTHSYESPSFSASSSTVYSRPSSISESLPPHRSPTPSYTSQPKNSHRSLYDSESTDSYESPSSSYSSLPHGSRPSSISESLLSHRPSHGSSSSDSQWSHTPTSDSPYSGSISTTYYSPSNSIYKAPSSTFHESLGSGEGGPVGATHTFVKMDPHGNVKWGVHHSVGNKYDATHH
jgi:hypothetical protein